MTETKLENTSLEMEINSPVTSSVIWLHGLGADGSDFVPLVPELRLPSSFGLRFIFPHAPIMPVTLNQGFEMRAWFDIYELSLDSEIDFAGMHRSVRSIQELIEKERQRGIQPDQIFLAGFSQGATIAMMAGLFHPERLGGVIALSGYLPLDDAMLEKRSPANQAIPIFLAHGREDPIVPYALGKATYARLRKFAYPISWHSYPMPHSVCGDEIKDISEWLQSLLPQ